MSSLQDRAAALEISETVNTRTQSILARRAFETEQQGLRREVMGDAWASVGATMTTGVLGALAKFAPNLIVVAITIMACKVAFSG